MTVTRVLLTVLLLQGGFPGAASDSVTLKEGENLNLHCTFSTPSNNNHSSTLQWLNPHGFTIFLNAQRVLRDQRYKLLRYSKDELSIQLSNVTVQDEGIYSCFYYSRHFQSNSQNVEILAAPSPPVLEISQDKARGIKLSCYSQGSKPQPQISWLLDNGVELPGDSRHQLGADGKKWSTSSTLRMLSCSPKATASCIIQHPALRARRLMASFHCQDLPSTGCKQPTRLPEDAEVPSPSENPAGTSSPENPAGTSPSASSENPEVSSPSASPENPEDSSPSASPENPAGTSSSAFPENPEDSSPSASPESPAWTSPSASPENLAGTSSSASPENPGVSSPSASPKDPAVPSSAPAQPNLTGVTSKEQNPQSKSIVKKEKNLLLPILVAALVFVLLIIVLLFMAKLKKAHGVWKRENDVSEQTLESYKSRSNEDSPSHEKNGPAVNPKSNMQYVTEGHVETPEKNLETPEKNLETPEKNPGDENTAISEEMFQCGRETDV
ncbi:cytotoxic and regulatory T-cell molecule [Poecile atricapillus]|uniref:cytotoxic and regulatory T-cell molecule n=1 Tax=Poecile atricapillus TaxID=48891 RepID=UPI002738BAE0|nr:cytotoxic and regulatory T-cell molecule [Poecile atricapillus]